jgi:hypothetical protein
MLESSDFRFLISSFLEFATPLPRLKVWGDSPVT